MNAKRLLKLAEFLERLPRKRFNYATWVGDDWEGKPNLSCGTAACALGWATTIPSLRRAGLRLDRGGVFGSIGYVTLARATKATRAAVLRGEFPSCAAAAHVFDITEDEATFLFVPLSVPLATREHLPERPGVKATPKRVARHIRDFVKRGGMLKREAA